MQSLDKILAAFPENHVIHRCVIERIAAERKPYDLVPTVNACSRLRSRALRRFGHRLVAARLADLERHFELRSND
ncbi:hypothetical protein, partial [Burkholderia vietnamiensis]